MKKCPRCGTANEDNVNFCTKCGYDFRTDQSNPGILTFLLGILTVIAMIVLCLLLSEPLVWLLLLFFILSMARGFGPAALVVLLFIFPVISIPYWIRLKKADVQLKQMKKSKIGYAFKWFLKGPFAYRDLKKLENMQN